MLEINLNKDYKIITDERNYALYRKADKNKTPKHKLNDGEAGWVVVGYYQDLDYLFSELIEREILNSDAETWQEVILVVKDLKHALIKQYTS